MTENDMTPAAAPGAAAGVSAPGVAVTGAADASAGLAELPRMGGIALKNGLILVSDEHWAAAVREPGGAIAVASGRKTHLPSGESLRGLGRGMAAVVARPRSGAAARTGRISEALQVAGIQGLPLLRGLSRFAETLVVLAQVKLRMPQAELPLEGGRVAVALATAFAATETVRSLGPKSALAQETGAALASVIPAVLSLRSSTITGYHGAEHKVIGGREAALRAAAAGAPLDARGAAGAAASAPKEHERCGSNLVGPLLLTTIAANTLLRTLSGAKTGRMTPATQAVAGAVSLGAALEALRWATKHGDSLAARALMSPGKLIQKRLTTSEPTTDQLEVAERAMQELLRVEGVV